VRDDVVELAEVAADLHQVQLLDANVGEPGSADSFLRCFHRVRCQFDADKCTARQTVRHRNQIAAVSTTEFQHAAVLRVRRMHSVQGSDDGKPVGMRLWKRRAGIRDAVVRLSNGRHTGTLARFGCDDEPLAPRAFRRVRVCNSAKDWFLGLK